MKNQENVIVEVSVKKLGRPVNPNSAAHLRKVELEAKRASGELKKGRPIVEGSKRQLSLLTKGTGEKGRPVNPNSKRQLRISMLDSKRDENGKCQLGRPKQVKPEVTEVEIDEVLEVEVTVEAVEMV
jgi:hypothetical protein